MDATEHLRTALHQLADRMPPGADLLYVYQQLALLADVEQGEADIQSGNVYTQADAERIAQSWQG